MEKFAALEPVKLHSQPTSSSTPRFSRSLTNKGSAPFQLIGRLPVDVHILILVQLPIPDIPAYSRSSGSLSNLSKDERVWKARWDRFSRGFSNIDNALDDLENRVKSFNAVQLARSPPTLTLDSPEDEFGEFESVGSNSETNIFKGPFSGPSMFEHVAGVPISPTKATFRSRYIRAHLLLKSFIPALSSPPHVVLSTLFPPAARLSLTTQAHSLRLLSKFFSAAVKPVRSWETLGLVLRAASDRFDDGLLTAFDASDNKGDEEDMREVAEASWSIWSGTGQWELARAWTDKREIFYDQSKWDPLDNFTKQGALDFTSMDKFVANALMALREHGARAVIVFPPDANVLLLFAERLANEVIAEYINPLLGRARDVSSESFLQATAACFREAWRMVDVMESVATLRPGLVLSRTTAEDVVYRMFESNMDEYLDDEIDCLKQSLEVTSRQWEKQLREKASIPSVAPDHARFLGSHNPAQVKRNVLASFTNVLLLPVTIVPRTVGAVGAALTTGGNAAVQGIAMLNPQRWGAPATRNGYVQDFEGQEGDGTLFEIGTDEEETGSADVIQKDMRSPSPPPIDESRLSTTTAPTTTTTSISSVTGSNNPIGKLDVLLSLDTALELIHADRDSLKRVETFKNYPGYYGHRVRDTIEEIFILLLQALGDRHIRPGFEVATDQMRMYKPAEHEETSSVAPLLQFFELVHVGDTMQSMIQVYFDKELAGHIDRTDFLNAVVREKKRFEDTLDDCVAAGLNAGTDALMNQVEHIILKLTRPREYYPPEDMPLELGPTEGCSQAIKCLQAHCQLLKGSTSKEVLEVFYQEIGMRLIVILQKHIKRQIISLPGGFQIIADLNEYYSFIASLKVQTITTEFSYLKMLGHVYVVEDAIDLAQIVRDVTRYGGAYRPEDVYEFIQRRSDWKKIEKIVDKTMYNLSFKEDCLIC